MEEVRRINTTRKTNTVTIVLLILAGVLGLGLISVAIYFYMIRNAGEEERTKQTTCACYYIDPSVISECGDPRRGFLFETTTVSGDETCKTSCSTNKLSANLLNSETKQELYQICQLQTVLDTRCSEMTIKDSTGKIVTGRVSAGEEITIEAKFDKEYVKYKFIINNTDTEPDIISPDKLTIKKTLSELSASTLNIIATATSEDGEQINSPLCRRLIEVTQEGTTNVSGITVETREESGKYKVSKITIKVGNITEEENLSILFSFDKNLPTLTMNDGFTLDTSKGELTILEQDLYNTENFSNSASFNQLDEETGEIEITAELRDSNKSLGEVSTQFELPEISEEPETPAEIEESQFEISKVSDIQCVERVSPKNVVQFTIMTTNKGTTNQEISSLKDKLPLGFTYITDSSKINGIPVGDSEYVTATTVGDSQEVVWENTTKWAVASGQSLTIVFQAQVGANALTGSNQNEVILTPVEIPSDPTTLRAEATIQVAQDCTDPTEEPETPVTEKPETPSTGIFDSIIFKIILGLFVITFGWYLYSKPFGKILTKKLIESDTFQELEIASWRVLKPKKYFEAKVIKEYRKKR